MQVKVIKEFLEIPVNTVGTITTKEGKILEKIDPNDKAMWIKFDCKDMPVGICLPFGMFIAIQK